MLLNPDTAFVLTGYPLARLRGMSCVARGTRAAPAPFAGATQDALYRGRVQGSRVRAGVWQFEIHSLHAYLMEMRRLETAPDIRRAIAKKGGLARAQAFTRAYQQWARAHVRHESNVANGRLGGVAYVRKYGKKSLVERARQYRLAHPSNLERTVREALHQVGAHDFEREGYIFPRSHVHLITGDFVFRRAHVVVYADGKRWHQDLPSFARCAERGTRDQHYDHYLQYRGWHVLRLGEDEILAYARAQKADPRNGQSPLLCAVRAFLRTHGAL